MFVLPFVCGPRLAGSGKCFEKLDRHDLLTVVVNRCGRKHADVFEAAHVVEVALTERHEETDTLDLRQIFAEGFDLLVVQQVHILLTDLIEVYARLMLIAGISTSGRFPQ